MLKKIGSALAVALLSGSVAFAAQSPSQPTTGNGPAVNSGQTAPANTTGTKKHHRHHKHHHKAATPNSATPAPSK